jgi:hypothetical protein
VHHLLEVSRGIQSALLISGSTFESNGYCKFADACTFAHSLDELEGFLERNSGAESFIDGGAWGISAFVYVCMYVM